MSAGVAAADVSLSGDARMGVVYNDDATENFQFSSRARVQFTLSGESDGGLQFGASFRVHQADGANSGTNGTVYIDGAFGKLSMGATDSAAENITTNLHQYGYTGLRRGIEYLTFTPTGALYEYSMAGFGFALSSGQLGNDEYSIGVSYSMDGFTVALGYEDTPGASHTILTGRANFSPVDVRAFYGKQSGGADQYGLSVSAAFAPVTVFASAKRNFADENEYGIGAAYDLGGGIDFRGAIYRDIVPSTGNNPGANRTRADLGLVMSF